MARNAYTPMDVACPPRPDGCGEPAGERCRSTVITGRPVLRRPHAARVTAARLADARRSRPRLPGWASEAWTCPDCGRSYWPPREWEPELWPAVRRLMQELHRRLHQPATAEGEH